ncbi:ABC transporter substrate-binding protein [Bacillus sp. UNC41MFS5]|uniref:ABC transporter substrate-binding protein n=1 Tax=Bacillus sp. UNC41MFS5 TaxID=1449046 RepID=UPI00047DCFA0|nr:ABC transporter substrate-binding protein [Bacillus sp. UNC41MFS5]
MLKIRNFKKMSIFTLLLAVLLVFSACSESSNGSSSNGASDKKSGSEGKSKDKVTIAIPFVPGAPSGAYLWLGKGLGFFEEEGLDVEIVALAGKPAEAIGLVVAGKADIAISQPDALVFPMAKGNDQGLSYIFTPYQKPVFGIAVEKSSDISSPKQLEKKTVAMTALGAPFETFMKANVKADGGDPSKIDSVTIGSGAAAMEALGKGDIDAYVGNQGDIAIASLVTGKETKILPFPTEIEEGFAAGFVIRKDTNGAKKDAIARYIRAVLKSAIFAQENPDKAVAVNWEMYPASKPTDKSEEQAAKEAKVSLEVTVGNFSPADNGQWGYISEERWQKFVDNNGLTDKISDVTKLFDYSLLDKINKFDEEEVRAEAKTK